MSVVALVTWIIAAGLGFVMLAQWVSRGGARAASAGGGTTSFTPALVFGHFLLAATGLVVWIIYLVAGTDALVWVAFALLAVVAVVGEVMFLRWFRGRSTGTTVESKFPTGVVYAHGLFAVVTAVLVLLVGLGVG